MCDLLNEQHETIERLKDNCKVLDEVRCEIAEENEQLKDALNQRTEQCDKYYEENEQLQEELKEFKDFVYSDEKILCYTCVNCLSKGIYQIECSEKGKVDVHGSCFAYWKKELEE